MAECNNLKRRLIRCWTKKQRCGAKGLESCGLKMGIGIQSFSMARQLREGEGITSRGLEMFRVGGAQN